MDENNVPDGRSEEEQLNIEDPDNTSINILTVNHNDAGPSTVPLPGAIPEVEVKTNFQLKPGISKSEHNIRHIITSKDVADALKTLNIGSNNQVIKMNELKIPIIDKNDKGIAEPTTFVDLKKFMATCFKINKATHNGIILGDVQSVQATPVITSDVIPEVTHPGTGTDKANEVLVANSAGIRENSSKVSSGRTKKTSETVLEKSNLGLTQKDSLSSIGSNVCRICMTKGRERLISPCNCKGSLANVHLTCLERWLNQVGRNHCELCGYSYPAIRTPRYTVLQALRLWFGNPRNRSHLQSDCLIFWLLSTVTAGLLAVCIVGTQYFVFDGNKFGKHEGLRKDEGISHRITETAMDFFMAVVLCGYSVTVYLLWKDHYVMWNRWRRANVNVRLLLSPDANPVPFTPRPRYNV